MAVVLVEQNRAAGSYQSPPLEIAAGSTEARITLLMSQAEIDTASNSLTYGLDGSWDGGQTWQLLLSANWIGGPAPVGQPARNAPGARVRTSPMPTHIRGQITTSARWVWGVDVVIV